MYLFDLGKICTKPFRKISVRGFQESLCPIQDPEVEAGTKCPDTSPPDRSYPVGLINEKLCAWSAPNGVCEPAWAEEGMNGYGMGDGYGLVNLYGQYPGQPTTYTAVDAAGNLHRVTPHVVNNGYVATTPSRPMMPLW